MDHGIRQFFIERTACRRRVSLISASLSLVLLGLIAVPASTPVGDRLRDTPLMRFGFQGPTRYVRLLQIEADTGGDEAMMNLGPVTTPEPRGGGGSKPGASESPAGTEQNRSPVTGIGQGTLDLMARALASEGRVPIFQSEELIIEELVKPIYPDGARDRGIEGRVSVLARVDTLGKVAEAQVIKPSGDPSLDQAAQVAVLKCRFRPYSIDGQASEVYAVFRFAFRIY